MFSVGRIVSLHRENKQTLRQIIWSYQTYQTRNLIHVSKTDQ